ncbi:uncharacterized protein LOC141656001 isoform X2 [Silene latifolia]|uniref:uncharacterized protein LOC141656001 isoform X2 n=1 Tax=Silene latifolia TaxID=37657 RepID=UPI003D76D24E
MEEQQPSFLSSGTRFDLTEFLVDHTGGVFPTLVRNDSQTINTYHLKNQKLMMLCFFCLPLRSEAVAISRAVSLVSSEMHAFGAFELIIFVDYITDCDDKDAALSDFISSFPSFCLTPKSTRRLGPTMPLACYPHGLLVNRAQMVEWHKPLHFFLKYGVDAFPFTSERLSWISQSDKSTVSGNCLAEFLCYSPFTFPSVSTFLRKYPGGDTEKATISDLQDKCVGLYLCLTGNLIPTLDNVHKNCCELGLEFEIILVYMPFNCFDDDPQLFQDRINSTLKGRNISWWVFPFINWVSRRLSRLSHQDADDRLIIIDPKSKYVEFHGEAVIRHHGASAYPFFRELLANREVERLREVTLESLFPSSSRDYVLVYYRCIRWVPIAALQGKTVFLYLHCAEDHSHNCFDRHFSYCQMKALDTNLDMVFVGLDMSSIGTSCEIPWFVFPADPIHSDYMTRTIFGKGDKCSTIIAFGKDGRISSLLPLRLVCSSCPDFPLCNNLHNEMSAELAGRKVPYADANNLKKSYIEFINQDHAVLPLLGKEYYFPGLPVRGEMKQSEKHDFYDCADKDEPYQYLASKTEFIFVRNKDVQYPKAIHEKVAKIDTSNFDVVSFLSADNRQYLIRNDNCSTLFEVERLRDKKWVMICCLSCPIYFESDLTLVYRGISDIWYELKDKLGDNFEMVLVPKMIRDFETDRSSFKHMLSGFPPSCLVVPFWDSSSRDAICYSLGFSTSPQGLFLRDKRVIWCKSISHMEAYGLDTFPFTQEDLWKKRDKELEISWNVQSLETLFGCSSAYVLAKNVLAKNPGDANDNYKSIEQLEKKLVGVYLCSSGDSIPMLHKLYEVCKANNIEFEIVVVYCHSSGKNSNMDLFQEQINIALSKRSISCWVLPYKGWVSRRLRRLLYAATEDNLIILGNGVVDPHGSDFIDPHGIGHFISDGSGPIERLISEFKSRYPVRIFKL